MSHYKVLVIHKENQNIEGLLAPYNENLEVEPYLKYEHNDAIEMIKEEYVPFNDFLKDYSDDKLLEWFADDCGYYLIDGDIYTTYNPNSKWDWYQIGGRFDGELMLTDEGRLNAVDEIKRKYCTDIDIKNLREDFHYMRYVNVAPLKYIQWFIPLSPIEKEELRRWWEINVEKDELKDGEKKDEYFFWNPDWYKKRYRDADTYIKTKEMITFFAVLSPDGKWYAPSNMGWWACTDGEPEDELQWDLEFYDRFIKPNLDSDLICTVVDCHI